MRLILKEINYIIQKSPDVVVVVAYGKILPSKLLNIKGIKFLNIHCLFITKMEGRGTHSKVDYEFR